MIATPTPADQLAEEARRGQEAFDLHVRPKLRPEDAGKFVTVEIHSGDYEIDADDFEASERLLSRRPGARVWLFRAGFATAYQLLVRRRRGRGAVLRRDVSEAVATRHVPVLNTMISFAPRANDA